VRRRTAPPVFGHTLALCLRPEAWAAAGRYKLRTLLLPVLVALLLATATSAVMASRQAAASLQAFAATYDAHYPAMVWQNDHLAWAPPAAAPAAAPTAATTAAAAAPGAVPTQPVPIHVSQATIILDPNDQTTLAALDDPAIVIGSRQIHIRTPLAHRTLPVSALVNRLGLIPAGQTTARIDSASLTAANARIGSVLAITTGTLTGIAEFLGNALWVLCMVLVMAPVVQLGVPGFAMPRRIAFRVALAVTVPLLIASALLTVLGLTPRAIFGSDVATLVWAGAAAACCFWAGLLATRVFSAQRTTTR
jgi:hypothetical protein